MIFAGKRCLITGATGGIGQHIAARLADVGCKLFLTATTSGKLVDLAARLQTGNRADAAARYEPGNLADTEDVQRIIDRVRQTLGSIDILVNCAGVFPVNPVQDATVADFDTSFAVNVRAPFMLSREFAQDMTANRWGRIINIGSSSSYAGHADTALYCATKHAILGLSRALHAELKEHNVRVFCLSPSGTRTEMGRRIKGQDYDTFLDPAEVAEYAVFIASFDTELVSEEIRLNRMVIQ